MRRSKTTRKTARPAKGTTKGMSKAKPPKTLQEAKKQIQELVQSSSVDIAEAVIDEACKGKYLPAKFLFETAGLCEAKPDTVEPVEKHEDSLAQILLEQWHLKPAPPDSDGEVNGGSGESEEDPVTVG
jgi:hypothetical protein